VSGIPFVADLVSCDFDLGQVTFTLPPDTRVGAGAYRIALVSDHDEGEAVLRSGAYQAGRLSMRAAAAEVVLADHERLLGLQTANAAPLSNEDGVNKNLRMVAVMLPELADQIRRLEP
jgi:hypothetical protein